MILEVLDDAPLISTRALALWDWISAYYMCSQGEVMRAALPSGLRPESESRVRYNHAYEDDRVLDQHERLLLEVIKDQGEVSIGDLQLSEISRNPVLLLKKLVEMGAVEINEFVRHTAVQKRVAYIRLTEAFRTEKTLHLKLDQLAKAPRQKKLLERVPRLMKVSNPG